MNLELFKRRYELPLASIRQLVTDSVRSTGNIEADCQQLTILNRLSSLEHALNGVEESDLIPHTIFREPIASREDAERLFRYLHAEGLLFHPEDDPADCIGDRITADDARELRHRMTEAYEQEWSEYDCPCGFILELSGNFDSPVCMDVMRSACELLADLAATFEHPGYIHITTTTHDFAIGDMNGCYMIDYEPLPIRGERDGWPDNLTRTATAEHLAAWIREQINAIQLKDTATA